MLVIGLMSGTSMDGITGALAEIIEERSASARLGPQRGLKVKLLTHETFPFSQELKTHLLRLSKSGNVREICSMNFYLGELFAQATLEITEKAGKDISEIDLIGSHGQTICHLPHSPNEDKFWTHSTLQIGEIDVIAERTRVTTIGDFRPRDIAAGGEGAPLIAYADYQLFWSPEKNRVILNIGGIANVTYIPAGASIHKVLAFDTGPGNMIIDGLIRRISGGRYSYDVNGKLAAKGVVNQALLDDLMGHPFIRRKPPKSTGREEFGNEFLTEVVAKALDLQLKNEDLMATVTAFTVEAIAENCRRFLGKVNELIASGGGAYNRTIMRMLVNRLKEVRVTTTQEYGIPVESKEALGFAILAYRTIQQRPNNVPNATGASKSVVLGKIAWGRAVG